jgi:hypothetical protein
MRKITFIIFTIFIMTMPVLSYGQNETKIEEKKITEKKISYSFINEYGYYFGGGFGFTGIFVNGIRFNKTQDLIGIGLGYEADTRNGQNIPIYVNYRHYFCGNKKLKPLINVGFGTRLTLEKYSCYSIYDDYYGYHIDCFSPHIRIKAGIYSTLAAGFNVRAFSLTSGVFFKTYGLEDIYAGLEVKVGFTF